jgi:hypothetical protein
LKKITGWIDLQYKIIITKYLNIAIAFHQTRACACDCSKKWRLQYISTLSKSDNLVGRESGYLKIFFTFLEVNMSNILLSMHICKRTFFQVCVEQAFYTGK